MMDMRDVYALIVHPFEMGTDKDAALKPLEEAAEVYGAWQFVDQAHERQDKIMCGCWARTLSDELADCIQACCNLAARYDIDLSAAIKRCEQRNRERGSYEPPQQPEMSEGAKRIFDRLMEASGSDGDTR